MTQSRATFTAWGPERWLRFLGVVCWIATIPIWAVQLGLQIRFPLGSWLLDWHVYAAAASDFIDRTLYRVPFDSPYEIPVEAFNYPPLSAITAIPFLPFPDEPAGVAWVVLNIAAVAVTALLVALSVGARHPVAWAAIGFAAYTLHPFAWFATLGNNSPFALLLVMGFVLAHLRGRAALAGALLGLAIGMKLWPIVLLPLLIRERSWRSIAWSAGTLVVVGLLPMAWLGFDALGSLVASLQVRDEVEPGNVVLGFSWLRETFDWWPSWGGYVAAALILAIPARGRTGLGLGILAGMAAIPNLWVHYLPAVVAGCVLLASGLLTDPPKTLAERVVSWRGRNASAAKSQ